MKLFCKPKNDDDEKELPFEMVKPKKNAPERNGNDNKVLAVWGSLGSGKTTLSCKLARYLASKKKNVVLILADMTAPPLPYICPPSELDGERSIGTILSSPSVDERLVQENCTLHRKNEYLTLIGMKKGENVFSYPPYTEAQAEALIDCCRRFSDYVIIDCTSAVVNDVFSVVAMTRADIVLRLVGCDLKSVSFLAAQLPLLCDARWKAEKQLKIASNVKPNQAQENIGQVMGGIDFSVPHSDEVEQQFLDGNLFADLSAPNSKVFRKAITTIVGEVFNV